jgi:molecular chaperone DnaK (HSP70)
VARLGIDYGTTHTVAVGSDRGRYPIIPHVTETSIGSVSREVFPSLIVYDRDEGRFHFGSDGERVLSRPGAEARYAVIRSLKRQIRDYAVGCRTAEDAVAGGLDPALLLREFLAALRASIQHSGVLSADEPLQGVITWPANANGAQRYLTRRCFRDAGFEILDAMSEPAAAAVEFADRLAHGNRLEARRLQKTIAVFDLGGGTFDVSLVRIRGTDFTVLASAGIERLGGDDFDEILARLFAARLNLDLNGLRPFQRQLLLMHARRQKESISEGATKSLTLAPDDLGLPGDLCRVPVTAFFKELAGLLEPAMEKMGELANSPAAREGCSGASSLDAVYLVGGSSRLPLVPTLLSRRFPDVKLIMTDKPFSSTAMGAAIHATEEMQMHDVLSRSFGVLRLTERGTREFFSTIFPAGMRLPQRGGSPVVKEIEYTPRHNIGHLRYLECSGLDAHGQPAEGLRRWSDVLYPYDAAIRVGTLLTQAQIVARDDLADQPVCETYTCDADGVITVTIRRRRDGQTGTYEVFRN